MAKLPLNDVASGYNRQKINDNFTDIEAEFQDKVLYRDNPDGEPNQMETDLDMNSKRIYNLPDGTENSHPATYRQLVNALDAAYDGFTVRLRESRKTATSGQTVIDFVDITYVPSVNNIQVYVNGVAQVAGIDYTETDEDTITFSSGLEAGDVVDVYSNEPVTNLSVIDPVAQAQIDNFITDLASDVSGEGASLVSMEGGPTVEVAVNQRSVYIESVAEDINGLSLKDGQQVIATEWHPSSGLGGCTLVYRASEAKSGHGSAGWSPTVPAVSAQAGATDSDRRDNYLDGAGETDPGGTGLFVIVDKLGDPLTYGAFGTGLKDDTGSVVALASVRNYMKPRVPESIFSITSLPLTKSFRFLLNGATLNHEAGASAPMISASTATVEIVIEDGIFKGDDISRSARQDLFSVVGGSSIKSLAVRGMQFINCSERSIGGRVDEDFLCEGSLFKDSEGYPIQITGTNTQVVNGNVITFDAAKTTSGSSIRAIQPTDSGSVTVTGNYMNSGRKYRDGVWSNDCDNVTISGNSILEHFDDSVTFVGICNHATVSGNTLSGSDATGGVVTVAGSTVKDLTISGNTFNDGIRAVYLFQSERVMVTGNTFNGYDYGLVLPLAQPSSELTISNNLYSNMRLNHLDLGNSGNIEIFGNSFGSLSDAGSVGIIGRTSVKVSVFANKFYNLTNRAVQTGNADWRVDENTFVEVPERCISVGDTAGTVGLQANGNKYIDCDTPLEVVSGNGTTRIVANNNEAKSQTDQKAAGNPAFSFGDATRFVVNGNIFTDYRRGAASAAGSDLGVFVGNDESGCGATSTLPSTTTSAVANNI